MCTALISTQFCWQSPKSGPSTRIKKFSSDVSKFDASKTWNTTVTPASGLTCSRLVGRCVLWNGQFKKYIKNVEIEKREIYYARLLIFCTTFSPYTMFLEIYRSLRNSVSKDIHLSSHGEVWTKRDVKRKIADQGEAFTVFTYASFIIIYYSTVAPFHHIWSKERAKYEPVMLCNVPVWFDRFRT